MAARQRDPGRLRAVFDAWRSGSGVVPTTRAGTEMAAVVMVVCLRVGTIVIMALAYSDAVTRSTRPWLSNVLFAVVVVESSWLMVRIVRRREYRSSRWVIIETSMGVACLLLEPWYVPLDARVGTWVGWAPGLAVNICASGAVGCRTRGQAALVTVSISAAYLAVSLPEVGHETTLDPSSGTRPPTRCSRSRPACS